MHYEASQAGFNERYRGGETPQTVHVWWARRPHAAMRALVYASVCEDESESSIDTMEGLANGLGSPDLLFEQGRSLVKSNGDRPRVLDMFGGGGTIPYEASLLGAESHSIDCNELSVFLQRSLLVHSRSVPAEQLAAMVRVSGDRVLKRLADKTRPLFPLRDKGFGYLWSYSLECSSCGYRFSLMKRPWLSKKRGRQLAFSLEMNSSGDQVEFCEEKEGYKLATRWIGRSGKAACPKCHTVHESISIADCEDELLAQIVPGEKVGKEFEQVTEVALASSETHRKQEATLLYDLGTKLPESLLPRWSGIVNPSLYGIVTHADFLNPRQRVVLLMLIKCLRDEHIRLEFKEGSEVAMAVTCLLSGLIDQLVDWNCRLSMWISQNEQVGRAFSGPGVAMLWDYVETDPVMGGPANLNKKLDRIICGTKALRELRGPTFVQKAFAQNLPYEDCTFDAVVTDPPYYDNIYYNALADFFFAWKKLLFCSVGDDLFKSETTDATHELVASTNRSGSASQAHEDYCQNFTKAIQEAERVLRKDGIFSLVYGHSSLAGWEAILRSYRATNLRVTSVQPLSIERKARPRAMTSDAVNTCVVFVARRYTAEKTAIRKNTLCTKLRDAIQILHDGLAGAGWHDKDIGMAAFSQGVGLACNSSSVIGCSSDADLLRSLASVVTETLPGFNLVERRSL
jgi:putative DNA methylase